MEKRKERRKKNINDIELQEKHKMKVDDPF